MFIKRLRVENFKSFRELDIELGHLNVLVGANASGKSNLVQVLNFLKKIMLYGLEDAISLEGGVDYLLNKNLEISTPFSLSVSFKPDSTSFPQAHHNGKIWEYTEYKFSLKYSNEKKKFEKIYEELLNVYSIEKKQLKEIITFNYGERDFIFSEPQNPLYNLLQEELLLIEHPNLIWLNAVYSFLENIPIYDFDPQELKRPQPLAGRLTLEENGSNLPLVLRNLLAHPEQKRTLNNLVSYLLPHIKDLHIQAMGNSLYFETEEIYSNGSFFPSSFLSPGTVNVIALIVALYFQGKSTMVFEEPERNIHPGLISKLMDLFKEVAQNKQIILTTHNPQLVKHTDLENLYLVSRDKEGFSIVTKPGERLEVQIFLEHDLGIDDLYVQNLLEGWA